MILGIDGSNIRGGGGVTYLVELLRTANPEHYGFKSVVVFGGSAILSKIDDRPWLRKVYSSLLDKALPYRLYWQRTRLDKLIRQAGCDLIYIPGGTYSGSFKPFVTISRNMLPFEWNEAKRYGASWQLFRLMLLRWAQSQTFIKANGVIFLTDYARNGVTKYLDGMSGQSAIIPHGVSLQFSQLPREQKNCEYYTAQQPLRVLYISTIDLYKHQWHVVEAISLLNKAGLPVHLDLIGSAYKPAMKRLSEAINKSECNNKCITYHGPIPYADLYRWYHSADLFIFASSCENMPNILLEAMASGLPVVCSRAGPMPEVLGEGGLYFDPEKPQEMAAVIHSVMDSANLRKKIAATAYARSRLFTWARCANETFEFMRKVASTQLEKQQ